MLKERDLVRYKRQLLLDGFDEASQMFLKKASVLIIGVGGLGSPAALYLAAAGIGRISLVDCDRVDLSNLQRQILHYTNDLERLKVVSGQEKLLEMNPACQVDTHAVRVDSTNIKGLIRQVDFVISAVDNFDTKYLINDTCVLMDKPFSHAGIYGWQGQCFSYVPGTSSGCLRCLMSDGPPKEKLSALNPVLGPVAGMLGVMQATECLKYIIKQGDLLLNRMLVYDAKQMSFKELTFQKQSTCSICRTYK